jgi:hypothetical protein
MQTLGSLLYNTKMPRVLAAVLTKNSIHCCTLLYCTFIKEPVFCPFDLPKFLKYHYVTSLALNVRVSIQNVRILLLYFLIEL